MLLDHIQNFKNKERKRKRSEKKRKDGIHSNYGQYCSKPM